MSNVQNVSAAKPNVGGAISVAPLGTAVPTDATTALAAAYKKLGYVSDDGLTNNNTPETDTIKAWGGDIVLTPQTEKSDEFSFTLIEVENLDVLKTIYGESNVTGDLDTGIHIKATTEELPHYVFVIDMILNSNVIKRIVIPNASITEIGEIAYKDDELVGYETTINALPVEGTTHHEYIKKATKGE